MTSSSTALHHLTIHEAAALIKSRQLSPVELTQAFLDRIEAVDDQLKTYITLLPDSAMNAARQAESEISGGNYRGPLHGIPIALKDLYDTAGVRTMAQSKVLEHRVPDSDATVVTRLRESQAPFCWGSSPCTSLPSASPPVCTSRPATHGTSTTSPAAPAAGQGRASPRALAWAPSGRAPEGQSEAQPPTVA